MNKEQHTWRGYILPGLGTKTKYSMVCVFLFIYIFIMSWIHAQVVKNSIKTLCSAVGTCEKNLMSRLQNTIYTGQAFGLTLNNSDKKLSPWPPFYTSQNLKIFSNISEKARLSICGLSLNDYRYCISPTRNVLLPNTRTIVERQLLFTLTTLECLSIVTWLPR